MEEEWQEYYLPNTTYDPIYAFLPGVVRFCDFDDITW
jgi:hypothetical protein